MNDHHGHQPRKRFGQHFLTDPGVIAELVSVINPRPGQHLVEIGPGPGALTGPLLEFGVTLDAIELDRDLVPRLLQRWGQRYPFRVHQCDALKFDFSQLLRPDTGQTTHRLRLVGNLPYNISTPLLFHVLGQVELFEDIHFMLQKEVVQRLAARAGSKAYGRLSVMTALHCHADALFTVGPEAFTPPPKVESAVIRLTPREQPLLPTGQHQAFGDLVRQAFAQRRKTLRNNMKGLLDADAISATGIDPGQRAETLEPEDFIALYRQFEAVGRDNRQ
jgi:16S rRNA (adenine1518-N6/adenine1519-N6)-dimethyltransferase